MLRDCSRPEDCKSSVCAIQIKASPRKLTFINFRGLPVSVFLFLISDCNLRAEEEGCLVVMLLHRHRIRVVTCEVCIVILVDVEDGEVDINLSAHQVHPGVASECGSSPFFASSIVSIKLHFPHDCIGCVVNRSVLVLFFLKSGHIVRKINLYGQIFLNIIYVACFLNCLTVVGSFLATGFDVSK